MKKEYASKIIHRVIDTWIDIDVQPEEVWEVLVNFKSWELWNSFIPMVEGKLKVGERVRIKVVPPDMKPMLFKPEVYEIIPCKKILWGGSFLKIMYRGDHAFLLELIPGNKTRFRQIERFWGPMVLFMGRMIKKTEVGYNQMNLALKKQVEKNKSQKKDTIYAYMKINKKDFKFLVENAVKSPSGHNTQPWKFAILDDGIHIHPDYSRILPAVDTDNHELWISLGCALENLIIAGRKFGLSSDVHIISKPKKQEHIAITFTASNKRDQDNLFAYIETRQSTRNAYSGKALDEQDVHDLETSFDFPGIKVRLFSRDEMSVLEPFIIEGSDRQFANKKFINELVEWCRFSEKEAKQTGDGLWSSAMGLPNVGKFIGSMVLKHFISAKSEAKRWKKLIDSSSGLALFIAERNDIEHWVNLGRAFERFGLTATKINICHAHMNMPCEEIEVRKKMAECLGLAEKHPLLLIRLGYSNKMPYSFRRPIEEVLIQTD